MDTPTIDLQGYHRYLLALYFWIMDVGGSHVLAQQIQLKDQIIYNLFGSKYVLNWPGYLMIWKNKI